MKQSIGYVALVVRDYDEALAFYIGALGFELVEDTYIAAHDKRWVLVAPRGAAETRLLLAKEWLDAFHPDPPDSIYTRWGLGHDPTALLEMFSGTRYDLRSIYESMGGATAATAGPGSSASSTSLVKKPSGK